MRRALCILLAVFFVLAGLNHFRDPALYEAMMPPGIPWPGFLQKFAGASECAGGIGLLIPQIRRMAAWGLILLLVAVFPANVHVALAGRMADFAIAPWVLWVRLPFQFLFIAAVAWVGFERRRAEPVSVR